MTFQYILTVGVNLCCSAGRALRSKGTIERTETSGGVIKIKQSGSQILNLQQGGITYSFKDSQLPLILNIEDHAK